jgi:tetratricopeptide (TPR) repeat protein
MECRIVHRAAAAALVATLGLLTLPSTGRGQAKPVPLAVGNHVVIKNDAAVKVGNQIVDLGKAHHIYTIGDVNGDWYWLVAGGIKGWVQKADIVTLEQAIAHCNSEIQRNPNAPWAYYNRGVIRQQLHEYDQAITDYTEAIRRDPNYLDALKNRGNAYLSKGEYNPAIADYAEALKLDPKDIPTYQNEALAFGAKKEYDKATEALDEVIRLGVKTARVYNQRGHIAELNNNFDKAIADYTEAIRLDPSFVLAYFNRGYAMQSKGDYEKALADYSEAIQHDRRWPWAYAARAWLLATCPEAKYRDGKAAIALADKAAELAGGKQSYFYEVTAAAHAEAGQFDQAIQSQTKAIEAATAEGANVDGDRARLKMYQSKKPFRLEPAAPEANTAAKPPGA